MLILNSKVDHAHTIYAKLVLPYELRENCRLRTALTSGEEVGIFTTRGTVLRNNDLLTGESGHVVQIIAAQEPTYKVSCETPHKLLRCAFHLGNRHTQTQIGDGFIRIAQDSVLKWMLEVLGAKVVEEYEQFEPESGAYSENGEHSHGGETHSDHGNGHGHGPLAPIPIRQKIHRPSDKT